MNSIKNVISGIIINKQRKVYLEPHQTDDEPLLKKLNLI